MKKLLLLLSLVFLVGCASSGIIGVVYNQHGEVRQVFPDSPAAKAGIKIGDRILNPKDLRGKIGTTVLVKYISNGLTCEKEMVREDIDKFGYGSW